MASHLRGEARANVAADLDGPGLPATFVRVNPASTGEIGADLDAAVTASLYGVVLPKAETPEEMAGLDAALSQREASGPCRMGRSRSCR